MLIGVVYGLVGECCMVISIVVLVGDVVDKIVLVVVECVCKLVIGDGMLLEVEMGLIVIGEVLKCIEGYIE